MWNIMLITIEATMLKTIQVTLPEDLLRRVDAAVNELTTTRSAFTRAAFENALRRLQVQQMEQQDAEGYARQPSNRDEVAPWETLQDWGDA